uniref:U6 snRNA-associated Sm-like protein LSm2 n=1 Tax=Diabrotica virgifera virgifera TaxID=50390 RepID=A0A6P7GWU2_DIAVI
MLFYSFFKSLVGKDVVVELKNDLSICGTLHSVDQYLNIKLTDISVTDTDKYPHMVSSLLKFVFLTLNWRLAD